MRLDLTDISKSYGDHVVLDGMSLSIPEMRTVAIMGPSGGGTSTLHRIIAGLEIPDRGTLSFDGNTVQFNESYLLPYRRRIGVVFQSFNLFPHLTALENISLPLEKVHGYSPEDAAAYAIRFFVNPREDEDRLVLVDYQGNEWPW